MAELLYEAKMTSGDKVFKELTNKIGRIVSDNKLKQKTSSTIALDLAQTINEKYVANLRNIAGYEHGSSNVKTTVINTEKGCIVRISGKDILYQEYGTGTRGLRNPHPRHDADGMKPYGSGQNIIHNGEKNNGKQVPYWYKLYRDFPGGVYESKYGKINVRNIPSTDFGKEPIGSSEYVWKHNGVVTKGLPAGRFIYDSCRKYKGDEKLGEKELLKRTVKQLIKKDVKKELMKTADMGAEDVRKLWLQMKVTKSRGG